MKTFLVASAVLVSCLAVPVRGQAATHDAEGAATELVAEAARAYDQNQLDEALRLLARAYDLSPRPSILYNQAQVFRAKDDCVAALDAYQRFIATTTANDPNRERALQRRAEMQACVDRRGGTKTEASSPASPALAPAPEQAPPSAAAPGPVRLTIDDRAPLEQAPPAAVAAQTATAPADDPGRSRRRAMRVTGWTLIGVGVLAASAAVAYAWEAHNIQEELNNSPAWTQSGENEGRRDATRARWLGAAAALAGGGGAALLVVSRPPATPGGAPGSAASQGVAALVGWSGTF